MKFVLTFDTGNDAFVPDPTDEILAILGRIRVAVADGRLDGPVVDTNGNRVGEYALVGNEAGS